MSVRPLATETTTTLAETIGPSGVSERRLVPLTALRWIVFTAYVGWFATSVKASGIPWDRERLFGWIIGALAVSCIGRPWRTARGLVTDWVPFIGIFLAYDFSRGAADALGMPLQVTAQLNVEKLFFFGTVPTVWLQHHLYDGTTIRWWDYPVAITYITHFFTPIVVAGVLWARNRELYVKFVRRIMTLSMLAVACFCLAPTAPPWMAGNRKIIPSVSRIAGRGWTGLGLHWAEPLIKKGQAAVNVTAAVPSLHAGYAALVAVFFWPMIRRRWLRPLLLIHPTMMVFAIVYGGEHYVVDAFAAYGILAVTCWFWNRWERTRDAPTATANVAVGGEADQAKMSTGVPTGAQLKTN